MSTNSTILSAATISATTGPPSPDGWMHDSNSPTFPVTTAALASPPSLASAAPSLTSVATTPTPIKAPGSQETLPPFSSSSTTQPMILEHVQEKYEADLKDLESDKTTVMQLEHALYEAQYKLQLKTAAFHAKYYPQGIATVPPNVKKTCKRRKRKAAMSDGSSVADATSDTTTKPQTRGWNNYLVFRKLCKELLPGSRTIRRAFNRSLWEHQKQEMGVFFTRHNVSPTACKEMGDIKAYEEHITTTVRTAMETEMPFYVEMIRLYDPNATDVENLTRLSTMCAFPMLAKAWSTDHVTPSQTLLMAVWAAFQGLLDLECNAVGIPSLFPETIPEGSLTPQLTEARLKLEVVPKLTASMPYLAKLFQACSPTMDEAEVNELVHQAQIAQAGGNMNS